MESLNVAAIGLQEGQLVAGKYRVQTVLGSGAMGIVLAAEHVHLETRVAMKVLLPHMLGPEVMNRFDREARVAAKITSEHVARVLDLGTLETGAPYIVMEYLEGADLSQVVKDGGALPAPQAIDYVLQACEAIAEAHALGIVHRDLKPANLFCTVRADGSPCIKVLDFGISKIGGGAGSAPSMTSTTALMGSPFYMSPEQMISSRDVDERTDVWAIGVTLFELLTGEVPFGGETVAGVCMRVGTEEPASLRRLRPELPEALEGVIRRCLEKNRDRRFRTIAEFTSAIAPLAPAHSHVSIERIVRTGMGPSASGTLSATSGVLPRAPGSVRPAETLAALQGSLLKGDLGRPRRRAVYAAVMGAAVGALIVVASFGFASRPASKTAPPALASPVHAGDPSAIGPSSSAVSQAPPRPSTESPGEPAASESQLSAGPPGESRDEAHPHATRPLAKNASSPLRSLGPSRPSGTSAPVPALGAEGSPVVVPASASADPDPFSGLKMK